MTADNDLDDEDSQLVRAKRLSDLITLSVTAGRVKLTLRPSGAWIETPCEEINGLIADLEAARDAAALMKSSK